MAHKYQTGDILAVDAPWVDETYYFLIEGDCRFDKGMGYVYPYRCLNDGKRGLGNFENPSTRIVA